MKKIVIVLSILLAVVACNQKPESYVIEGSITGELENGTKVFLKKRGDNNQLADIDTTSVENGKFMFDGKSDIPELYFVFVDQLPGYSPLILENGDIELKLQKDSLNFAKVKGTPQNDMLATYTNEALAMNQKGMAIQKDLEAANNARNEVAMTSLKDEMNDFQQERISFESDFIKANPSALVSVMLLDGAIARRTIESSEIQGMYDAFTPEMKETKSAKRIAEQLEAINAKAEKSKSTAVGQKAPEFSAPGVNGEELALQNMLGKVTLVDFWAAWCKPCRAENPNVVAVYKKYHAKGLNIVGVSLDRNADDWKKAIKDDDLTWNHVSHIKYFQDPIAQLYNVDAIPAAFLLDENGVIIAKNLRGSTLEAKVSELLD